MSMHALVRELGALPPGTLRDEIRTLAHIARHSARVLAAARLAHRRHRRELRG